MNKNKKENRGEHIIKSSLTIEELIKLGEENNKIKLAKSIVDNNNQNEKKKKDIVD